MITKRRIKSGRIGATKIVTNLFLALCLVFVLVPVATAHSSPDRAPVAKYTPDELLVKLKKGLGTISEKRAQALLNSGNVKRFPKMRNGNGKENSLDRWRVVKVPAGKSIEGEMERLRRNPNVEYIERNAIFTLDTLPNDPMMNELWGLNNQGQNGGVVGVDIDATKAWSVATGGEVVVAVIDTGIDYLHEDLAANMWLNSGEIASNGLDDDGNGYIDDIYGADMINQEGDPADDHGHGTHVAGTVAAVGNNAIGVTGVNWQAKLMAVKGLNHEGSGTSEALIESIVYAVNNGAQIINASWGGPTYLQALYDAIATAEAAGVLFVASAGNSASDNDLFGSYPSSYDLGNIISVAAIDRMGALASFSNWGQESVDIGAPGVDILSTVPTGVCTLCDPSGYLSINGTSMAAPHVAGAAALLLSQNPELTLADTTTRLFRGATALESLYGKSTTGALVNAHNPFFADYQLTFSTMADGVIHGSSEQYTLTIASTSSYGREFTVHQENTTGVVSAAFSSESYLVPAGGTIDIPVTLSATAGVDRGMYPVLISVEEVATGAASLLSTEARVLVPDFTVEIDGAIRAATPGLVAGYPVVIRSIDGFAESVTLSATSAHPELDMTLSSAVVSVPAWGVASLTLDSSAMPEARYEMTITGENANIAALRQDLATLYVTNDVANLEVCVSPLVCTYSSIQQALNNSAAGTTIDVGAGVYKEYLDLNGHSIVSRHGAENTVIDAEGLTGERSTIKMHYGRDGNNVDGFTVRGGVSPQYGGAIEVFSAGTSSRINNNIFEDNIAVYGAAIVVRGYREAGVTINDNLFRNNIAVFHGTVSVVNSYVNTVIANNRFEDNYTHVQGAGVSLIGISGSVVVTQNLFKGNTGLSALYAGDESRDYIVNNLFVGNDRAIAFEQYSRPTVINNTITENGVGIYHRLGGCSLGCPKLINSIVWGNGDDILTTYVDTQASIVGPGVDPMFVGNGNYQLLPSSPAIDTGIGSVVPHLIGVDYAGTTRPQDGDGQGAGATGDGSDYDMGAYEYVYQGNLSPIVDAGLDQTVTELSTVSLVATASDLDGTIVSVQWTQLSGPVVTIAGANTLAASFTAPAVVDPTVLSFEFSATDDQGATSTDTVNITVDATNVVPVVDAGADQATDENLVVTLQGSASDSDGSIASVLWSQLSGPVTTITNPSSLMASFTAPSVTVATTLTFELTATDNDGASSTDQTNVIVNPVNVLPQADAGMDQEVLSNVTVTLDGTASSDSDGTLDSYSWTQLSGPTVTLTGDTSVTASFVSPVVSVATPLTFELQVIDNEGGSATDQITITVVPGNAAPVADAGVDQTVVEAVAVNLTGSASYDSDGSIVSYSWSQLSGSAVTLNNATSVTANFVAPNVSAQQILVFELLVEDNNGATATDQVTITVNPASAPPQEYPITWVDKIYTAEYADGTLRKTRKYVGAGATSLKEIVGDGGVKLTPSSMTAPFGGIAVGLSEDYNSASTSGVDYGFYLLSDTQMRVIESGVIKMTLPRGGNLQVYRVGNEIHYSSNGEVVYVSERTTTAPLRVQASFVHMVYILNDDIRIYGSEFYQDTDRDGVYDHNDAFPEDPTQQ